MRAFVMRQGGPAALAAALSQKTIPPDTAKLAIRSSGNGPAEPGSDQCLAPGGWIAGCSASFRQTKSRRWWPMSYVRAIRHGEAVYRRKDLLCQRCHAIGGAGGRVAPT